MSAMSTERQAEIVMHIVEIVLRFADECAEKLTPRGKQLFYDLLARGVVNKRKENR